jgi:hypothetical protein
VSNAWRSRVLAEVATAFRKPARERKLLVCAAHLEDRRPEKRDPDCHRCRRDLIAERAEAFKRRKAAP